MGAPTTDRAVPSLADFARLHWHDLRRFGSGLTGSHADGEDLVQTALLKVAPRWHRMDGDPLAYVRRVMVHENISRWRRHRGRETLAADPHAGREPTQTGPEQHAWDVAVALRELTPKQRTVLVLRYLEDRTERETADLMGVRIGTVKSATRDALAALRRVAPHLLEDRVRTPHDG